MTPSYRRAEYTESRRRKFIVGRVLFLKGHPALVITGAGIKSADSRNSTRVCPGRAGSTTCIWWMFQLLRSPSPPSWG
jgi:hypothetical protein